MNKNHINSEDLSAYADGEAADSSHIEEHLAHCSSCREELNAVRFVQSTLHALPRPGHNADFTDKVLTQLENNASDNSNTIALSSKRQIRWISYVAAAAVLILLASVWVVRPELSTIPGSESSNDVYVAFIPDETHYDYLLDTDVPFTFDVELLSELIDDEVPADNQDTRMLFAMNFTGHEDIMMEFEHLSYDEVISVMAASLSPQLLESEMYSPQAEIWDNLMALDETSFEYVLYMLDDYLSQG